MIMARQIFRGPHSCGTRKGFAIFETGEAKCFSCNAFYKDYLQGEELTKTIKLSKKREPADVSEPLEYKDVEKDYRGIKPEYYKKYGVKQSVSEADGITPQAMYFPYKTDKLVGWKVRLMEEKKMWTIGSISSNLFGWDVAITTGSKKLFITEGEYDAIALYQILVEANKGTQWADRRPAVVSIPNGVGSATRAILAASKEIHARNFDVVLCFDMDEAGKKATEEVLKILPEATVAQLPAKDVNECLMKGMSTACKNAVLFNATTPMNSRIVKASTLREKALEAPEYGEPYPWAWLTEKTRGIRTGETIYIGAGQKQGKSEIVNTLAAHCMKNLGWNVFLCKPEEANVKTYKMVAGKLEGKFFHDPTKEFDKEAFDRASEILDNKLFMLDLYQNVKWESLKDDIRTAVKKLDCKAIFIDPITNLTNGMESAQANVKLQEIAQELSSMAKDLDCVIFIFCHLRNPEAGPPHERGGKVLSSQFAGSRAMARSCNYMLGLEGNRDPELSEEERNMRKLVLLEDREYGEVGTLSLYWDKATGLFNPVN